MKEPGDLYFWALTAFFVGLSADHFVGASPDRVKFALDVLTALGTVGAVLVALSQGLRLASEAHRRELVRGRMACSLLFMRISRAVVDLWGIVALLSRYQDDEFARSDFLRLAEFSALDTPLAGEISVDTLEVLAGISDQAAIDLGLAASKLKVAVNWRDMHRDRCSWAEYAASDRQMIAAVLRTHVHEAALSFEAAASEMQRLVGSDLGRSLDRINARFSSGH